jgi:2-aminoadipate transaminase
MSEVARRRSRFAQWLAEGADSSVDDLVNSPSSLGIGADLIGFGHGQPAVESYPLEDLARAFSRAVLENGREMLPYGPTEGIEALREIVAERLAQRGIFVGPESVIILTGSMQGLHLIGRVTLDMADTIVTEAPTFMGALACWEHKFTRYLTIPVDENGMQVDALEEALRHADQMPRFVYAQPTFQNPSGVSLTLARRQRLLELAQEFDLIVIEDDPYGDFWFDSSGESLPPLRSLPGSEDHVIYLGTFSKILAPGLRLAYAVAEPKMLAALGRAKRGTDLQTDAVLQQAVVHLIRDPEFDIDVHIGKARAMYKERRDALLDSLEVLLSDGCRWTHPLGGFFLWLDLPDGMSGQAVAAAALGEGVALFPGDVFYPNFDGGYNGLRFSYANTPPDRIREGIRRLARTVDSMRV